MADLGPVTTGASVRIRVEDWRAAVRAACQPLVDAGAVESQYADRCVQMVEEHGPYVVIAPGLALAHARPEDGVRRLCLAVATLAQPVPFGHPDNDPVDVVLAFGSPDDRQHLDMISTLARRLMAGLDAELRAAATDDDAKALLEGDGDGR